MLCDKADETLFDNIITNSTHPLHILLPPKVEKHYSTRPRSHCYQLPHKTSVLDENNFFYCLLDREIYRLSLLIDISIFDVLTAVCLFLLKYYYYYYYYYYYQPQRVTSRPWSE